MSTNSKLTKRSLKQIEKITGEKLTLGRFLWAIRKADDMTQVDFAKKLGISKQHLCDIEHNRKNISTSLAGTYAVKLGYAREQFIRLSLQDMLDREGLDYTVELKKGRSQNGAGHLSYAG